MSAPGHIRNYNYWPVTLGGITFFVLFYLLASNYYPGGSNFDQDTVGFNWYTNYWCELLNAYSKNGRVNEGQPYALTGMVCLTASVGWFWYQIPSCLNVKKGSQRIITISGILSMVFSSFIFTDWHDSIIYSAVACGTVAFTGCIYGLFRSGDHLMGSLGVIALMLILTNCLIYLTTFRIEILPLLQKYTFGWALLWICLLSIRYRKTNA